MALAATCSSRDYQLEEIEGIVFTLKDVVLTHMSGLLLLEGDSFFSLFSSVSVSRSDGQDHSGPFISWLVGMSTDNRAFPTTSDLLAIDQLDLICITNLGDLEHVEPLTLIHRVQVDLMR